MADNLFIDPPGSHSGNSPFFGWMFDPTIPGIRGTSCATTAGGILQDSNTGFSDSVVQLAAWNRLIWIDPAILSTMEPTFTTAIDGVLPGDVITQDFCWGLDIELTTIPANIDKWYGSTNFANYGVVQPIYESGFAGLAKWINNPRQRVFFEHGKVGSFVFYGKPGTVATITPFLRPSPLGGFATNASGGSVAIEG